MIRGDHQQLTPLAQTRSSIKTQHYHAITGSIKAPLGPSFIYPVCLSLLLHLYPYLQLPLRCGCPIQYCILYHLPRKITTLCMMHHPSFTNSVAGAKSLSCIVCNEPMDLILSPNYCSMPCMNKSKHEEESKEDNALLKDVKSAVGTNSGTERMSTTPLSSSASRLSQVSESRREQRESER